MASTTPKRILVSGGAGFLGSHLCDRLLADAHEVVCLDNFFSADERNLSHLHGAPGFTLLRQDVCDPVTLQSPVDEIYSMACPASPIHYQQVPVQTARANLLGTANLLELARAHSARVLYVSSSEVYGDPTEHPQAEDYPGHLNPVGPRACYNETKRGGEALCVSYRRQFGLEVKIARVFNTYGPRMRPDDGRVISSFIDAALRGAPLTLHGTGEQTRSFCYVDDLVEGLVRLMDAPAAVDGPVNLGRPQEHSIRELAEHILRLTGARSELVTAPRPAADPERRCPDITLAQETLGWSPTIDLEQGLQRTIRYYEELASDTADE